MPVKSISEKDNFDEVLGSCGDKLVMIDFYANWCGPCRTIKGAVEDLATQYAEDVVVMKVDVDECVDLAARLGIQCMPTFLFFKGSKKVAEFSGANKEKLNEYIMRYK